MPLKEHETTMEQYPGLTRRFPVRLVNPGVHMVPGRSYNVLACMFTNNPAFAAVLACTGQFEGSLHCGSTPFAQAEEAIYLHVLGEVANPSRSCKEPTERRIEWCDFCRAELNDDSSGHERGCPEGAP